MNKSLPYHNTPLNEFDIDIDIASWQELLDIISNLFSAPSVLINQSTTNGIEVISASSNIENPYSKGAIVPLECNIYCHHVVNNNSSLRVKDAAKENGWLDNPEFTEDGFCSYLGLPLNWPDGRIFGTLCVMDREEKNYSGLMLNVFKKFKQLIEYELALVDRNLKLTNLSMLDEMTTLYNRRGLLEAAAHLIALAERSKKLMLVVYIDVDNLKQVNDQYGHDTGDRVIMSAAHVIKTVMRGQDIACRSGGDEFILIALVEETYAKDRLLARINSAAAATQFLTSDNSSLSLSVSLGAHVENIQSRQQLEKCIDIADRAMYKVKQIKKSPLPTKH